MHSMMLCHLQHQLHCSELQPPVSASYVKLPAGQGSAALHFAEPLLATCPPACRLQCSHFTWCVQPLPPACLSALRLSFLSHQTFA